MVDIRRYFIGRSFRDRVARCDNEGNVIYASRRIADIAREINKDLGEEQAEKMSNISGKIESYKSVE